MEIHATVTVDNADGLRAPAPADLEPLIRNAVRAAIRDGNQDADKQTVQAVTVHVAI